MISSSFHSYNLISSETVILEDETVLQSVNRQSVVINTKVKGRVTTITINDVVYVSKLKGNLLSMRHLVFKRLLVEFSDEGSLVLRGRDHHTRRERLVSNQVFKLHGRMAQNQWLWHNRVQMMTN